MPGGGNGNTAVYTAPLSNPPGNVITAVSAFDPLESGTATLTIISSAAPTLTSAAPNTVGEGSAQQEVYLTGTNFTSNSVVLAGTPPAPVPTIFLSTTLLHAKIPAAPLSIAGPVALVVQAQNGDVSNGVTGPQGLTVMPSRPAVVALSPDTIVPNAGIGRRESDRRIFFTEDYRAMQRQTVAIHAYQPPAIGRHDTGNVCTGAGTVSR